MSPHDDIVTPTELFRQVQSRTEDLFLENVFFLDMKFQNDSLEASMKKRFFHSRFARGLFFGLCLALGHSAFCASFTVKKVKGKQALIEYSGPQLENGKTYSISSPSDNSSSSDRSNFAILREISLSSLSSTASGVSAGTSTSFSLLLGYGWNYENFEFAPLLGFGTASSGGASATSFTIGALGDYNFQSNIVGNDSIWGLGAEITSAKRDSGSSSETRLNAFAGGFLKWFIFSPTTCLRLDLGYVYSKRTTTVDAVDSGLLGKGGFAVYF